MRRLRYSCLTHLCLASHIRGIGKQCRPRSDAAECGVWSGSTLFTLNIGISVEHGNNIKKKKQKQKNKQKKTETPSIGNGQVQRVEVREFTRHKWAKTTCTLGILGIHIGMHLVHDGYVQCTYLPYIVGKACLSVQYRPRLIGICTVYHLANLFNLIS